MPMPMQDYGSIHESSKYRMHLVPPMSLHSPATSFSNGTSVSRGGSADVNPAGRPPPPAPAPSASATLVNSATQAQRDANQTIGDPSEAGANALSSDRAALSGSKRPVKYKECLKNHAANIGGHALDGCGEFMPSGKEGSLEALKCAACGCHRNFHRREVEGESLIISAAACGFCAYSPRPNKLHSHDNRRRFVPLAALQPSHPPLALPAPPTSQSLAGPPRSLAPLHMQPPDMATADDHSAELAADHSHLHNGGTHTILSAMHAHHQYHHFGSSSKKRFRTKFSSEQKDRMFNFAEKLGWRIQKHDETAVHHFCADAGVKRHVFKVWMHNNKSTFVKKILPSEGGQYLDNEGSSPATSSGMQS